MFNASLLSKLERATGIIFPISASFRGRIQFSFPNEDRSPDNSFSKGRTSPTKRFWICHRSSGSVPRLLWNWTTCSCKAQPWALPVRHPPNKGETGIVSRETDTANRRDATDLKNNFIFSILSNMKKDR